MVSTGLMMTGHGCVTPVLPLYACSMGASVSEVGLSLSAFAVARLLLSVPKLNPKLEPKPRPPEPEPKPEPKPKPKPKPKPNHKPGKRKLELATMY